MEQEKLSQLIEATVQQVINDNKEFVSSTIVNGISHDDGWEKCIGKAAVNAVTVATRLSIQTVITILLENGTLTLSEDALRPQLTVIRGGFDSGVPDQSPQK